MQTAHIQTLPNWQIITGSSINGRPDGGIPKMATTLRPAILAISIQGEAGKYSDGVARSPDIPIPPNTGHALLTFKFSVNEPSLDKAQGLEMGAKFTLESGLTLNGQVQLSYADGTMTLCLTSATGSGWTRTTVVLPKFAPKMEHTVSVAYALAPDGVSVPSVAIDGTLHTMPGWLVPGKMLGWAKGAYQVNCQANCTPRGGEWEWHLIDVTMDWA